MDKQGKMCILVACEESQAVTIAFRKKGHLAFSCDLQPCSGGHPEWHIYGDVLPLLNGASDDFYCRIGFYTQDGCYHLLPWKWDMIIAHPPCTYLTAASAVRLFDKDHYIKDLERYDKGVQAARFFNTILAANSDKIAVENPVILKCFDIRPYDQKIEPFFFGDPWRKRTCLWLKGLPPLQPTNIVEPLGLWVGSTCANRDPSIYKRYKLNSNRDPKIRAKTFPGIAAAMADQWG